MKGKLYGVGVGPGDPGLITLKAVEVLENADIIAVPRTSGEKDSLALTILNKVVEHKKEIIDLIFPMSYDEELLKKSWETAIAKVREKLDENSSVAFITLGDPTVYSTYMYLHKVLIMEGYTAEIIPGITSFCASAARAGISLGENRECIAVIPSAYECESMDYVLDNFDNIVLMKASKKFPELKEKLLGKGLGDKTVVVSRCGFEDERVEYGVEQVGENLSYFTTMIIKKSGVK